MKKVLKWVLVPIAVVVAIPLLLLILLFLCFPIHYRIFAKIDESKDISAKISYLFGLIRFKYSKENGKDDANLWIFFLRFGNKTFQKNKNVKDAETSGISSFIQKNIKKSAIDKDAGSKKVPMSLKDILTFGAIKTIIKDSIKTTKKLLMAIRPKYIDIEGEFGRKDPADTAILYGGYEAVSHILDIRENVRLQPVFGDEAEILRLKVDIRGRVNVYRLIIPSVRLLLSKPIRDLILKGDSDE